MTTLNPLFCKRFKRVLILFLTLSPCISQAAISFSEVAWMGNVDSANYEWIELHNDGDAVDVTGWTVSDAGNLSIELAGTIPANSYVVLERTSDASAKGDAFLIYTGALVNTGSTLFLKMGDGSLVDQLSGGDNWSSIGGDNLTKETAQYTNSGWVTAAATPGSGTGASGIKTVLSTKAEVDSKKTLQTPSTAKVVKISSGETVKLIIPDITLQLLIEGQKVGYVNQEIDFSVKASGIGKHLVDSLRYEWNFGDGMIGSSKEISHKFSYPGTYVVTVYGGFKRQEQVARHEITVLPVAVSLTRNNEGDVQVNNDSPYEIDISGYRVQAGKDFIFPPRSIILPNQTITLPKEKLGSDTASVALRDTSDMLVIASGVSANYVNKTDSVTVKEISSDAKASPFPSKRSLTSTKIASDKFGFVAPADILQSGLFEAQEVNGFSISPISTTSSTSQTASLPLSSPVKNDKLPYLALAGMLSLGVFGIYINPKRTNNN